MKTTILIAAAMTLVGCKSPLLAKHDEPKEMGRQAESEDNMLADCSKDGAGRTILSIPNYMSEWSTNASWIKSAMSREIDEKYYHWLAATTRCLPGMKPVLVEALKDGKITWSEYEGPISAEHRRQYELADQRDHQRAANELRAVLR